MAKRIGLLTCGGDAPGQNFCLKTIAYNAIDRGFEVVGIRKGWEGLVNYDPDDPVTHTDNAMIINKPRIHNIEREAGSFLHSSRINPDQVNPQDAPPFLRISADPEAFLDLTNHIKRSIASLHLDTLVVLGDDKALQYAYRLSQEGVPVIGVPKSVHNNIHGSAYSLGFSTAIRRGVRFVREIQEIAASREEIAVISVLGRSSGLATMLISMFASADRTLIPEVPFDPHYLGERLLRDKRQNPSNYAILVMSEGAYIDPEKAPQTIADFSADIIVASERGTGPMIARVLESVMGEHLLYQPLSYLTRTGDVDGWDLIGALNLGLLAVELAAKGRTGYLVAYRLQHGYIEVPLEAVTESPDYDIVDFFDAETCTVKPSIYTLAARRALEL